MEIAIDVPLGISEPHEPRQSSAELRARAVQSSERANRASRWVTVSFVTCAAIAVGGAVVYQDSTPKAIASVTFGLATMVGSAAVGLRRLSISRNDAWNFGRAAQQAARRELISSDGPAERALYGDYLDREKPDDKHANVLRAWKPEEPAPF